MHLTIDKYSELGFAYVKDFFTSEEVEYFKKVMLNSKDNDLLQEEKDIRYYKKSIGGCPPEFKKALHDKTPIIKDLFKLPNVVAESVYARIYFNESTLNPHVDRPGLDHTLSVTLFSNLDNSWPLYCLDKNFDMQSFDIAPGDGAMMYGTKMTHWRKPLVCKPDQYVVQAFFHWKDVQ